MRRVFILMLAILSCCVAVQASAHSKTSEIVPTDGDMVEIGHSSFEINFQRKVRFTKISLHRAPEGKTLEEMVAWDSEAGHIDEQHIESKIIGELPKGFVQAGTFGFEPLDLGIYHIEWIVVAKDGHIIKGAEHFEVVEPVTSGGS